MGFNFTPDSFLESQEFSISEIANNQTQKFQIPLSGLALNLSLRDFQNHINYKFWIKVIECFGFLLPAL